MVRMVDSIIVLSVIGWLCMLLVQVDCRFDRLVWSFLLLLKICCWVCLVVIRFGRFFRMICVVFCMLLKWVDSFCRQFFVLVLVVVDRCSVFELLSRLFRVLWKVLVFLLSRNVVFGFMFLLVRNLFMFLFRCCVNIISCDEVVILWVGVLVCSFIDEICLVFFSSLGFDVLNMFSVLFIVISVFFCVRMVWVFLLLCFYFLIDLLSSVLVLLFEVCMLCLELLFFNVLRFFCKCVWFFLSWVNVLVLFSSVIGIVLVRCCECISVLLVILICIELLLVWWLFRYIEISSVSRLIIRLIVKICCCVVNGMCFIQLIMVFMGEWFSCVGGLVGLLLFVWGVLFNCVNCMEVVDVFFIVIFGVFVFVVW